MEKKQKRSRTDEPMDESVDEPIVSQLARAVVPVQLLTPAPAPEKEEEPAERKLRWKKRRTEGRGLVAVDIRPKQITWTRPQRPEERSVLFHAPEELLALMFSFLNTKDIVNLWHIARRDIRAGIQAAIDKRSKTDMILPRILNVRWKNVAVKQVFDGLESELVFGLRQQRKKSEILNSLVGEWLINGPASMTPDERKLVTTNRDANSLAYLDFIQPFISTMRSLKLICHTPLDMPSQTVWEIMMKRLTRLNVLDLTLNALDDFDVHPVQSDYFTAIRHAENLHSLFIQFETKRTDDAYVEAMTSAILQDKRSRFEQLRVHAAIPYGAAPFVKACAMYKNLKLLDVWVSNQQNDLLQTVASECKHMQNLHIWHIDRELVFWSFELRHVKSAFVNLLELESLSLTNKKRDAHPLVEAEATWSVVYDNKKKKRQSWDVKMTGSANLQLVPPVSELPEWISASGPTIRHLHVECLEHAERFAVELAKYAAGKSLQFNSVRLIQSTPILTVFESKWTKQDLRDLYRGFDNVQTLHVEAQASRVRVLKDPRTRKLSLSTLGIELSHLNELLGLANVLEDCAVCPNPKSWIGLSIDNVEEFGGQSMITYHADYVGWTRDETKKVLDGLPSLESIVLGGEYDKRKSADLMDLVSYEVSEAEIQLEKKDIELGQQKPKTTRLARRKLVKLIDQTIIYNLESKQSMRLSQLPAAELRYMDLYFHGHIGKNDLAIFVNLTICRLIAVPAHLSAMRVGMLSGRKIPTPHHKFPSPDRGTLIDDQALLHFLKRNRELEELRLELYDTAVSVTTSAGDLQYPLPPILPTMWKLRKLWLTFEVDRRKRSTPIGLDTMHILAILVACPNIEECDLYLLDQDAVRRYVTDDRPDDQRVAGVDPFQSKISDAECAELDFLAWFVCQSVETKHPRLSVLVYPQDKPPGFNVDAELRMYTPSGKLPTQLLDAPLVTININCWVSAIDDPKEPPRPWEQSSPQLRRLYEDLKKYVQQHRFSPQRIGTEEDDKTLRSKRDAAAGPFDVGSLQPADEPQLRKPQQPWILQKELLGPTFPIRPVTVTTPVKATIQQQSENEAKEAILRVNEFASNILKQYKIDTAQLEKDRTAELLEYGDRVVERDLRRNQQRMRQRPVLMQWESLILKLVKHQPFLITLNDGYFQRLSYRFDDLDNVHRFSYDFARDLVDPRVQERVHDQLRKKLDRLLFEVFESLQILVVLRQ